MSTISQEIEKAQRDKKAKAKQKAERLVFDRERAYKAVFDTESPMVKMVLEDLARFCRASESTYEPDPRLHALVEGRREVWLRISQHLNLGSAQLWELYTKTKFGE